jgi:hypothetical protein
LLGLVQADLLHQNPKKHKIIVIFIFFFYIALIQIQKILEKELLLYGEPLRFPHRCRSESPSGCPAKIRTVEITYGRRTARKPFAYATPLLSYAQSTVVYFKLRETRKRRLNEKFMRGSIENIYTVSAEFDINSLKVKDF